MTDLDDLMWFIFARVHVLKPPQANYGGRVTDVHDSLAPGNVQQPGMYTVDWSTVESASHLFLIRVEKDNPLFVSILAFQGDVSTSCFRTSTAQKSWRMITSSLCSWRSIADAKWETLRIEV